MPLENLSIQDAWTHAQNNDSPFYPHLGVVRDFKDIDTAKSQLGFNVKIITDDKGAPIGFDHRIDCALC